MLMKAESFLYKRAAEKMKYSELEMKTLGVVLSVAWKWEMCWGGRKKEWWQRGNYVLS